MPGDVSTGLGLGLDIVSLAFFGSFNILVKIYGKGVDPMVYQAYMSFTIFWTSFIVVSYSSFEFSAWGILGAALWVPSSVLSIFAIKFLGMSVAQGLWSGVTIIISFLWGAIYFSQSIGNWYLTILGLILLLVGIYGISTSSTVGKNKANMYDTSTNEAEEQQVLQKSDSAKATPDSEQIIEGELLVNGHRSQNQNEIEGRVPLLPKSPKEPSNLRIVGLACAIGLGLTNGSMLVPAKKANDGVQYVPSFGIGVVLVTPILLLIYCFFQQRIRKQLDPNNAGSFFPDFHFRTAFIPGSIAGAMWNVGNVCSIYAVNSPLGLTIGFPISQCALLVAGLWGVFYFKELATKVQIIYFFISGLILILGAILLAAYG